ncbi:MAG: hypothetical protein RR140_03925 [Clostridia bacterium]
MSKKKIIFHEETPRSLWGKVVIALRKKNEIALHIACADITNVSIEENVFVIKTTEQYLVDIIKSNITELEKTFNELKLNFSISLQKQISVAEKNAMIIDKIKKIAGDKFKE